jgi:hypothetical protein
MEKVYVVRESVGGKRILTHIRYGTFTTYEDAQACVTAIKETTGNPMCFPEVQEVEGGKVLAYLPKDPANDCP